MKRLFSDDEKMVLVMHSSENLISEKESYAYNLLNKGK